MKSDSFTFSCSACGQHIAASSSDVGANANCPSCNTELVVPDQTVTEPLSHQKIHRSGRNPLLLPLVTISALFAVVVAALVVHMSSGSGNREARGDDVPAGTRAVLSNTKNNLSQEVNVAEQADTGQAATSQAPGASPKFSGVKWSAKPVSSGYMNINFDQGAFLGGFTDGKSDNYGILISARSEQDESNQIVWEAPDNKESCMWTKITCATPGLENHPHTVFFQPPNEDHFVAISLGGVKGMYRQASQKGSENLYIVGFKLTEELKRKLQTAGIKVTISNFFDIPDFTVDLPVQGTASK